MANNDELSGDVTGNGIVANGSVFCTTL